MVMIGKSTRVRQSSGAGARAPHPRAAAPGLPAGTVEPGFVPGLGHLDDEALAGVRDATLEEVVAPAVVELLRHD